MAVLRAYLPFFVFCIDEVVPPILKSEGKSIDFPVNIPSIFIDPSLCVRAIFANSQKKELAMLVQSFLQRYGLRVGEILEVPNKSLIYPAPTWRCWNIPINKSLPFQSLFSGSIMESATAFDIYAESTTVVDVRYVLQYLQTYARYGTYRTYDEFQQFTHLEQQVGRQQAWNWYAVNKSFFKDITVRLHTLLGVLAFQTFLHTTIE